MTPRQARHAADHAEVAHSGWAADWRMDHCGRLADGGGVVIFASGTFGAWAGCEVRDTSGRLMVCADGKWKAVYERIPEGAMRVAPGSDAVVWRTNPEFSGEL